MRYMINIYVILIGKPERKKSLGKLRHGWGYDIKMYFK
jgi:hypothetical protein